MAFGTLNEGAEQYQTTAIDKQIQLLQGKSISSHESTEQLDPPTTITRKITGPIEKITVTTSNMRTAYDVAIKKAVEDDLNKYTNTTRKVENEMYFPQYIRHLFNAVHETTGSEDIGFGSLDPNLILSRGAEYYQERLVVQKNVGGKAVNYSVDHYIETHLDIPGETNANKITFFVVDDLTDTDIISYTPETTEITESKEQFDEHTTLQTVLTWVNSKSREGVLPSVNTTPLHDSFFNRYRKKNDWNEYNQEFIDIMGDLNDDKNINNLSRFLDKTPVTLNPLYYSYALYRVMTSNLIKDDLRNQYLQRILQKAYNHEIIDEVQTNFGTINGQNLITRLANTIKDAPEQNLQETLIAIIKPTLQNPENTNQGGLAVTLSFVERLIQKDPKQQTALSTCILGIRAVDIQNLPPNYQGNPSTYTFPLARDGEKWVANREETKEIFPNHPLQNKNP